MASDEFLRWSTQLRGAAADVIPRDDGVITSLDLFTQTRQFYSLPADYLYEVYFDGYDAYRYPDAIQAPFAAWWDEEKYYRYGDEPDGSKWLEYPDRMDNLVPDNERSSSLSRFSYLGYLQSDPTEVHYNYGDKVIVAPHGHLYDVAGIRAKHGELSTTSNHVPVYLLGKYLFTFVTERPDAKLEVSSINRISNSMFSASWKLEPFATSPYNTRRVTSISVGAGVLFSDGTSKKISEDWELGSTSYTFSLDDILGEVTRESLFPYTDKMLDKISFTVYGGNHFGSAESGSSYMDFSGPQAPTIGDLEYDPSTGITTATITAPASWGEKKKKSSSAVDITECVAMEYVARSRNSNSSTYTPQGSGTTYESSIEISFDAVAKGALTFDGYIELEIQATSLGVAGMSQSSKKSLYVSYPTKPIVTSAIVPSADVSDNVILYVNVGRDERHPTTNVKLQKLVNVTYESESDIPVNANWQDTDSEDNSECIALGIPVADVYPQRGRKTWVRVKSWNMDEELCRYSAPVRLTKLERPERTAADDLVTVAYVIPYKDGTSAEVMVAWDRNGRDDSNRTELSWSTSEVAWRSTSGPSTFDMPDDEWDEGATTAEGYNYRSSATVYISGLQEGEQHYVRARRVRDPEEDDANGVTYGPYSSANTVTPSAVPTAVTAEIPDVLPYGEPMHVDWSYTSVSTQTAWAIVLETVSSQSVIEGSTFLMERILATGEDAMTSHDVPWSAIAGNFGSPLACYVSVWVSTGSDFVKSDRQKVRFAGRPVIDRVGDDWVITTVKTQPVVIPVICSEPSDLTVTITSRNATRLMPDGARQQVAGDTVWSGVVSPSWRRCDATARATWASDFSAAYADFNSARTAYQGYMTLVDDATATVVAARQELADANAGFPSPPNRDDYETEEEYEEALEDYADACEQAEARLAQARDALQSAYTARASIDPNGTPDAYRDATAAYQTALAYYSFVSMEDNARYVAVVTIDDKLDMIDQSTYDVSIVATSLDSKLTSYEFNGGIYVDYEHGAPNPEEYVTVTPYDTTDNGVRRIGANVSVPYFAGMFPDDVFDVYRMVNGKAVLAASGVRQNSVVNDGYSPFGGASTAYRVATRTTDGYVTWFDFPYEQGKRAATDGRMLRIDWNGTYVELDHCITNSDAYQKDFEATKHLDGSVSGHWNEGSIRTASLSAAAIDVYEVGTLDKLRNLAEYDGPCFVRTSDGIAYEADVQVGGLSESFGTAKVDISLSASEVDLTDEYMAVVS